MRKLILLIFVTLLSIGSKAQITKEEENVLEWFRYSNTIHEQQAIILVNGYFMGKMSFGYIEYSDSSNNVQKIPLLCGGGVIEYTHSGYTKLSVLPDSTQIKLWLCLKSPVFDSKCYWWDTMMVGGTFYLGDLCIKSRDPHIILCITTIKKKYYKITLYSNFIHVAYKDTKQNALLRRRIEIKDWRLYHEGWGTPLW